MSPSISEQRRAAFQAAQAHSDALWQPGTPEDLAPVIAFLCAEENSYPTGQIIVVTGTPGRRWGEDDGRPLSRS